MVNGCFWHGHHCRLASKPKTNGEYWSAKIMSNQARDARNTAALRAMGWQVLEIWECEVRRHDGLEEKISLFLNPPHID